jgi:hypothetical protein
VLGWAGEDTGNNTFNIRDEANGLNLNFMSYFMYSMAGEDPAALIDLTAFTRLASKTFTTFFQHFAGNNISLETGSWAYQSINASMSSDLTPAVTVWLSVGILVWLIIATAIVTIFHRQYLRRLNRNVKYLGDVLVLTASSEDLVYVIQEF